jgi:hypothetical protein
MRRDGNRRAIKVRGASNSASVLMNWKSQGVGLRVIVPVMVSAEPPASTVISPRQWSANRHATPTRQRAVELARRSGDFTMPRPIPIVKSADLRRASHPKSQRDAGTADATDGLMGARSSGETPRLQTMRARPSVRPCVQRQTPPARRT